jgi:hypothetical protein
VSEREVHANNPEGDKQQTRAMNFMRSAIAPMISAGVDDRKHQLVHREGRLGRPAGVVRILATIDPARKSTSSNPRKARGRSTFRRMLTENQRVTADVPKDRHQAGDSHALREDGEDILGTNESSVEQARPGSVMKSTKAAQIIKNPL